MSEGNLSGELAVAVTKFKSMVCTYCERAWPVDDGYANCPGCREETEGSAFKPAMDEDEAYLLASWYAFGWWLWDHERL